ncbi:NAD(+)--dinitrogen-reductase ADP-D-ribosyltransferase [Sideroxydans sp. CL21]|uniref:NAD(+)--dinitrogen-reductase ADP-D-ribosyltransferase n=1 Tax=Sideroxydans sp. CL21 TaxID=2600596 RepID=UPI0024BD1CF5|nr:NAD(+)--dinitrogen-reductase ADP-D-ribosyltransferase [Sideroxydans sp. CL21]
MQEKNKSTLQALVDVQHNKTDAFVGVATSRNPVLPRSARLPINRCNLPADILGGLTFQRSPVALELDGVAQFHRGLFKLLDQIDDATDRADAFTMHMNASFYLDEPEQAGYTSQATHKRQKADYLRMVRGWSFDADGREGAALKGWVESRFGLLPRHHGGHIRNLSGEAYRHYLEMRASALYGTNALESQFDLLYTYCQYELARQHPGETHLTLYRGVNRVDDYETLSALDEKGRVVLFNSLSSFTASRERADEFGDYLLSAQVPLAKVFCYTRLLPGMLQGEDEFTVIGGLYEVNIAAY